MPFCVRSVTLAPDPFRPAYLSPPRPFLHLMLICASFPFVVGTFRGRSMHSHMPLTLVSSVLRPLLFFVCFRFSPFPFPHLIISFPQFFPTYLLLFPFGDCPIFLLWRSQKTFLNQLQASNQFFNSRSLNLIYFSV